MGGKDQEGPGQQGDRRQHGQIDPIGPGQAFQLRLGFAGGLEPAPRGQVGGQVSPRPLAIHAGREAQVDAGQAPDLPEGRLRGGDVHHRQGLAPARPGDLAGDGQDNQLLPRLDRQLLPAGQLELTGGGGTEKEDALLQRPQAEILSGRGRGQGRRERLFYRCRPGLLPRGRLSLFSRHCPRPLSPRRGLPRRRHRQEGGGDSHEAKEVDAQDAQGSLPTGQARLDLQQGTGLGDLRPQGQAEVQFLVKAGLGSDHLEIGLATEQPHAAAKLAQGLGMDELHRQAQGHPQGDGQDREQGRQTPAAETGQEEVPEDGIGPPAQALQAGHVESTPTAKNRMIMKLRSQRHTPGRSRQIWAMRGALMLIRAWMNTQNLAIQWL